MVSGQTCRFAGQLASDEFQEEKWYIVRGWHADLAFEVEPPGQFTPIDWAQNSNVSE